jgi:NADH dehydrogenase [ubiquinone] 1 alpha subcomplex assembly factor 6
MLEANLRDEDVFRRGAEAPGLKDAVFKVATRASDHIITARTMLQNLSRGEEAGHDFEYEGEGEHQYADANEQQAEVERRYGGKERSQYEEVVEAFGVMMPAVSTSLWLDRLQRVDFDVFREELRRREWRLPWKAYWAFRRKMF